jgi:hypothetical protein
MTASLDAFYQGYTELLKRKIQRKTAESTPCKRFARNSKVAADGIAVSCSSTGNSRLLLCLQILRVCQSNTSRIEAHRYFTFAQSTVPQTWSSNAPQQSRIRICRQHFCNIRDTKER